MLGSLDGLHGAARNPVYSIVQRKVLTPSDFPSREAVAERLLGFQEYYESIAKPFQWNFTRQHLTELLAKTDAKIQPSLPVAA